MPARSAPWCRALVALLCAWIVVSPWSADAAPDAGPPLDAPTPGAPDAADGLASLAAGLAPDDDALRARRTSLERSLSELPAAAEGEPDAVGDARRSLEARKALIDDVLGAREAVREAEAAIAALPERRRAVEEEAATLGEGDLPPLPEEVDAETLERIEGRVEALRQALDAREAERQAAETRLDRLPGEVQQQRGKARTSEARVTDLASRLRGTSPGDETEQLRADLEQARLEVLAAEARARRLDVELQQLRAEDELRMRRIEVARQRLQPVEAQVEQARDRFERTLEAQQADVQRLLEDARAALEKADGESARFLAEARVLLAESRAGSAEAARMRISIDRDLSHQRKLLGAEKAELASIGQLVRRDASQRTAQTLKGVFQRLDRRFEELRRARSTAGLTRLSDLRNRRLEVATEVYALDDTWQGTIDALPDEESRKQAQALRETLRAALRSERDVIAEALASGEALQSVLDDREDVLGELDALVRTRIFWVQDKAPIGTALLADAQAETNTLLRHVVSRRTWSLTNRVDAWAPGLLASLALVGSLIVLLAWWQLRKRLAEVWLHRIAAVERRRAARAREEAAAEARVAAQARLESGEDGAEEAAAATEAAARASAEARAAEARAAEAGAEGIAEASEGDEAPPEPILISGLRFVLLGASTVTLLPLLLFVLARLLELAPLTDVVRQPMAAAIDTLSAVALLVFLTRLLLRPRGLAPVELGLAADTTTVLRRSTRTGLLVGLATLVPLTALSAPPLRFDALPRLFYTAFELALLVLLLRLLRPRSPVVRDMFGRAAGDEPLRGTGLAWSALAVFGVVVVGMDLGGYRYGSHWLAGNALGSLAVLGVGVLVWPPVRERVAPVIAGLFDDGDGLRALSLRRARRVLRGAFVIGGVLALGLIWDIDSRALGFLDAVTVYTLGSGEGAATVTLADVASVLLIAAVIAALLRWLPGLFGLSLFRYIDMEAGARYAIVTIARYIVLFVGLVVAFDALHIDLSKLSWLVAAVGVGLGFGLQEIVANFVSGIILLMERPIRIGDWVTIGSTEGTVQKIQIRATTLLTLDRQEIIVPNKDFITREVINWTHRDRVVRLSVPIGVAYGTDVERVRQLLIDVARQNSEVLTEPPPNALMMAHGDSSLDFELRVHHLDPTRQAPLRGALNMAINRALAEADIEIPFPQRDLHLRSGWPPPEAPKAVQESTKEPTEEPAEAGARGDATPEGG